MPPARKPRPRPGTSVDEAAGSAALASKPPARKAAGRRQALSAGTLEALGARRLAELLMDTAGGDPALARTLRLAQRR